MKICPTSGAGRCCFSRSPKSPPGQPEKPLNRLGLPNKKMPGGLCRASRKVLIMKILVSGDDEIKAVSPPRAIREVCVACCGGCRKGDDGPRKCNSPDCAFYPYHMAGKIPSREARVAIRRRCLQCVGGQTSGVRDCSAHDCPLYPYRMGVNR